MNKNADEIKSYWENRAQGDDSVQSTTMDIWLREIESKVVQEAIYTYKPSSVCDVGCGDGRTTIKCAKKISSAKFFGFDYAESMVENARKNSRDSGVTNIEFNEGDVTNKFSQKFDFAYSTRCLINLVDWDAQQLAIKNIQDSLNPGGIYLMIENFVEGQDNFNSLRKEFELPEIPVREHNTFFNRKELLDFLATDFDVLEEVNISSSYYLVSRIIYSAICDRDGVKPDYNDIHHVLGSQLPFLGEYGPVRALTLKKKI